METIIPNSLGYSKEAPLKLDVEEFLEVGWGKVEDLEINFWGGT
jgi:hypothetical protein